ncbi:MAG: GntR family transcriptional regulator [Chloroflexota bacterium]
MAENSPLPPLQPILIANSLEKMAYDSIKAAILSFRIRPGETLVENDLARQLGISKTPVRESLSRLEREGFVIKYPYKGYAASPISAEDMRAIFEVRAALEGLAAALACQKLSAAELEELRRIAENHARAAAEGNLTQSAHFNRQFHNHIITAARNIRLSGILANLEDHLQRYRVLAIFQPGRLQKSVEEHRIIVEALLRRDAQAAESAQRRHLLNVLEDLAHDNLDELIERALRGEVASSGLSE